VTVARQSGNLYSRASSYPGSDPGSYPAKVIGNIDSDGAVPLAAGAIVEGDIDAVGAVALGAGAAVNGNIDSDGAVPLGAGATVFGIIDAVGAVTLGAGAAVISGSQSPTAGPIPSPTNPTAAPSFAPSSGPSSTPTAGPSYGPIVCEDFALLAGSSATCAGVPSCVINGFLGVSPGTSVTGFFHGDSSVNRGIVSAADSAACAIDGLAAWTAGRAMTSDSGVHTSAEIGGMTFKAGIHTFGSSINIVATSPTVTLDGDGDANAVFIFNAGSTLTTSAFSKIELVNGARKENVYWYLGSALTMGANSILVGNVYTGSAITIGTNGKIDGRAIAQTAVTCETACCIETSGRHSASPSAVLSAAPSAVPSAAPSAVPSAAPSAVPSATPSATPSSTPSPGGFNVRQFNIVSGGGATDFSLSTTTESRALDGIVTQNGPVTVQGGQTYNVANYFVGVVTRVDMGSSSNGDTGNFPPTDPYPNPDFSSGIDFLVSVSTAVTIPPGEYTMWLASDDGRILNMPGITFTSVVGNMLLDGGVGTSIIGFEAPVDHTNSRGTFTVGVETTVNLSAMFWEEKGNDSFELAIASGLKANVADFTILADGVLGWAVKRQPA
jgi:cytoskeletal protein CcmA (bactofilin family)